MAAERAGEKIRQGSLVLCQLLGVQAEEEIGVVRQASAPVSVEGDGLRVFLEHPFGRGDRVSARRPVHFPPVAIDLKHGEGDEDSRFAQQFVAVCGCHGRSGEREAREEQQRSAERRAYRQHETSIT